jgi:serine protease AprX
VFDPAASAPVEPVAGITPLQLRNFPNPSAGQTKVSFTLPRSGHVSLHLFDNLGRRVATLLDESREAGEQSVAVDAADLPAGVYLYRLRTENGEEVGRMVIAR